MKRLGGIVCLVALIVTMTASMCFGTESLKVVESYPKDGQKNTTTENMGVKLWFNNDMGAKDTLKANNKCFKIVGEDGKKLPIKVFYSPNNPKEVMVLLDANKKVMVEQNSDYKLVIDGNLQDSDGNKLGKDETITFRTLNQKKNTTVYMGMMGIMMVGMFVFSSIQMKRQMEGQTDNKAVKEEPFNPYKEAKKQGKSVEEVIRQHEKEVERQEAKEARKAKRHSHDDDEDEEEEEELPYGHYRVKGPRPISASGSTYITGRKAEAEARKAEEERLEKRRAANKKKKKK